MRCIMGFSEMRMGGLRGCDVGFLRFVKWFFYHFSSGLVWLYRGIDWSEMLVNKKKMNMKGKEYDGD